MRGLDCFLLTPNPVDVRKNAGRGIAEMYLGGIAERINHCQEKWRCGGIETTVTGRKAEVAETAWLGDSVFVGLFPTI